MSRETFDKFYPKYQKRKAGSFGTIREFRKNNFEPF